MRHRNKLNQLGRKSQHRKAMLSNMAASLILHKRIYTTLAKAKALKVYVEPLITKSKEDSTHSRRTVFSYLGNKHAVSELFREVSQKVADRPGGYTRILKTGFRKGDAAEMCFIELVDYNTNMIKTAEDTSRKTRRSRRGKKSSDQITAETTAAVAKEAPVSEEQVDEPKADNMAEETPAAEVEEVKVEEEVRAEEPEPQEEEKPEVKAEKKETPEEKKADDKEEAEDKKEDDNKKQE